MPQLAAQLPTMIGVSQGMQAIMKTMYSTFSGLINQIERMTDTSSAMGQAFDDAKSDDYFYLPPEAFADSDFQRGLKLLVSPDGTSTQFVITHDVDPATPEGISTVDAELTAAKEAVKGTPLADARFSLGGAAATFRDIQIGANWDLAISALGAITLIFMVMVIIIRALIAALVIVGTGPFVGRIVRVVSAVVAVRPWYGSALDDVGILVIILLAVGSDYNLLIVSRFKEEIGAGINTGIIRSMGATGGVVTSRPRLRRHNVLVSPERLDVNWPGRNHDWPRTSLRHAYRAFTDDAIDRGPTRPLVLVATEGTKQTRG